MLTGCTAHGRFLGRVCVLSFRTHQSAHRSSRGRSVRLDSRGGPGGRHETSGTSRRLTIRSGAAAGAGDPRDAGTRPRSGFLPRGARRSCGGQAAAPTATDVPVRDERTAALVFDRQRRLARSRSVVRRRGARAAATSGSWSRSPTSTRVVAKGSPLDRPRAHQHDLGLHAGEHLSDAARAALDRSDVARRGEDRLAVVIELVVAPDGTVELGHLWRTRPQPRQARVQQRRRVADGHGPAAGAAAAAPGIDAQSEAAGRRRAGPRQPASRARRARVQDDRGAAGLRRRHVARPAAGRAEPREGTDRESHGRRQRRDRAVPRRARLSVDSPRREDTGALGPHRRARRAARRSRCRATPDARALNAFLLAPQGGGSDTFPDLSQAIIKLLGSGEYVVEPPGADPPGHFGLAVQRLHALDGAEPPLSRPADAASAQGGARRARAARTRSRARRLAGHCTHRKTRRTKWSAR